MLCFCTSSMQLTFMNIKNITTPSTEMWGESMKNFVKFFAPVYVIAVTVYSLGVDYYKKPSLLTNWLFAKPTTQVVTPELIEELLIEEEIEKAVSPLLEIPVEQEHTRVVNVNPDVRHRTTRRRSSMDLIRSLSA